MLNPDFTPEDHWNTLHCPHCGDPARPHVLLFDEMYDEEYYRYASSLRAAEAADRLLIIGTTGATNLPNQVVQKIKLRGKPIDDMNVERNDFTEVAEKSPGGRFWQGKAGDLLPLWVDRLLAEHPPIPPQ
jgi:NAD-dependent deacetylase